jgi:hypothetical protein
MSAADSLLDAKPGADAPPEQVPQQAQTKAVSSPSDALLDSPPGSEVDKAQEAAGKPAEGEWGKLAALKIKTAGQLAWNLAWKPSLHVPEAPKNLPDLRYLGPDNPAVLGAVYNGAIKPFFESASSPGGVATMATSIAGGAELRAGKMVLKGISGLFGGIMAKEAYDQFGAEKKIRNDPASSFQDVVESYARQASTQLMAVAGLTGAILPENGGVMKPGDFKGTPGDVANKIRSKIPEAPFDQVDKMKAAADKIDELHTKQSDAAQAWDEVKQVIAPQERGEPAAGEKLSPAKITAGSLREHGAELAQRTDRAVAALDDASKTLMKLPLDERLDFIDKVETGADQETPELQAAHHAMREILDTKREEIRALGTGKLEHFIEDYFPHIWEQPEEAADAFRKAQSKAPLEGAKSFLKQRTIPTIKEGMELGLKPVSTNPVDMVLLKAREMDKYALGQKWLREMKDREFVKPFEHPDDAPPGWVQIDDPIAKAGRSRYYAPNEIANVANNYLSPGLRRFATYRAYVGMSNSLNQFQLGLSAFHLGFTSLDTSISKLALALEHAKEGNVGKAAKEVAKVPVAPITNALQGNRVLAEWMKPGTQGEEMGKIADAIRMAGGRAKMDAFYQTSITKRMQEMFHQGTMGGTLGGLWRTPFAAMEQLSKPLMEYLVPRQKLGVAADLMRKEMDKLGPNAKPEEMRDAFGKVWDSVDNRMGQLVYDNLFWKKTVKDLAMASVRSVGWDLGTVRELGGGMKDTVAFLKDTMDPKKKAEFTHRMAYMVALPTMTGILGATYQYLKTGKGPEELRDYFFPKTGEVDPQGRDVRLAMPSYMKDVYHYAHAPLATIEGKVSPFPALVSEMLNNKDFFGRDIRNSDDPLVKQMQDEAKFFIKSYEPIGIRQFTQSTAAKQTTGERAANFVGVTRAPAWVGETDAEQLAGKLAGDKFKGSGTPDADLVMKKQQIQLALRGGDTERAETMMDELQANDQLTSAQRKNLVKGTDRTYLENAISHLDANEAMRVFKVADPKEREALADTVQKKIDKAHLPDGDREALQAEFDKLMPVTRDIDTTLR